MSEQTRQQSSPLVTERGSTIISEGVVAELANRAAGKVEGIHLGGASGSGGFFGRGSSQGMSVQVGRTETALDLKLGIDYGRNFVQTVEQLRRGITEEIEGTTGLRVTELNATITEIVFPEDAGNRAQSNARTAEGEQTAELDAGSESETRRVR